MVLTINASCSCCYPAYGSCCDLCRAWQSDGGVVFESFNGSDRKQGKTSEGQSKFRLTLLSCQLLFPAFC